MPITFDTLEELQEFYRTFRLDDKAARSLKPAKTAQTGKTNGKAAASASKTAKKEKAKPGRKPAAKVAVKPAPAKKSPAKSAKAKPAVTRKATAPKAAAPKKVVVAKDTLTGKIRETIQRFLDKNQEFTANDIHADLSKRDPAVNKQSVITSVLKQMNSTFKQVPVTERPGQGPRPVKLYNPQKK